jgi:chromosomal replication initiator protein
LTSDRVAALGHTLCQRIGEPRYDLWFKNKTKFTLQDERLVVGVPNLFYQEWLQKTFAHDVQQSVLAVLGEQLEVDFLIDSELFQSQRQEETNVAHAAPVVGAAAPQESRSAVKSRGTPTARSRRWRSLDQFVVGACNRVAHAAALHLVEEPGQGPTPLVLHGPVGVGKSHLLEGTYLGLKQHFGDDRVLCLTAEDFTNRFLSAMHQGKLGAFRKTFRECDALLVDDLNFLARKNATQEEFLHTLDALARDERIVVVTCDCHPRLADQYLPELTDRLLGGSVWCLNLPDPSTRLGILRARWRQQQPGTIPPDGVLEHLADALRGNTRELEGALNSVLHLARATGRRVDLPLAKEALADVLRHSVRVVQLGDVDGAVCAALGLGAGSLQSKKRGWQVAHPRMLAMYLARKHTAATYSEIGQHFGRRNHSTVVAAERKVRDWLSDDESLPLGQRQARVRDVLDRIEQVLLG